GQGDYHKFFLNKNIPVTGVDVKTNHLDIKKIKFHNLNIFDFKPQNKYQSVITSHVIEHCANTEIFVKTLFNTIEEESNFCIIWPKPKFSIVGGHVHIFNPGLVLYNLIRCGIDCRKVHIIHNGYSYAVMGVYKRFDLPNLTYDKHELLRLSKWFPCKVSHNFNGNNIAKGI
ncbi:MAG: hypothetical protein ACOC80_15035, partial [Petrotogales bacterium]